MKLPYHWKRKIIRWQHKTRNYWHSWQIRYKNLEVELYDLNEKVRPYIRWVNILLFGSILFSLIFSLIGNSTEGLYHFNQQLEIGLLATFCLVYLTRLFLTSQKFAFICIRYFESFLFIYSLGIFIALFIADLGHANTLARFIGQPSTYALIMNLLKVGLGIFIFAKVVHVVPFLLKSRQHPGRVLSASFMILIFIGAGLLMLPETTVDGRGLDAIDALFTSTSAVCVTGLIVVDTATHFTLAGKLIIMTLIQLGGIGMITFATFFALFIGDKMGMGQMAYLRDIVQEKKVTQTLSTLKKIVALTFTIESIGAIGFFLAWQSHFDSFGQTLLYSAFHAVSAFCNAGFALFTNSLADPGNALSLAINGVTMFLIVMGGLGFATTWEVFTGRKKYMKSYSTHTKLVLITTTALISIGFIVILLVEWNGALSPYSLPEKIMISLFQSITTRTAGFNTIDISGLGMAATMIIMILMAIGASPASTGGGLKTTSFAVMLLAVWSALKGQKRCEFAHKTIPVDIILKAFISLFVAGLFILIGTFLLTITESGDFMDLLFEQISAFATVGLSRGATSELTEYGKVIITITMYVGRVGSLTLFAAFADRTRKQNYQYPSETVMVT